MYKVKIFFPERDELWAITNHIFPYEAYAYGNGKIALMGMSTILEGINRYYNKKDKKSRELRNVLRHYGLF